MGSNALLVALPAVGGLAGAGMAYLGVRRRSSGKISNTDADKLWDAISKELDTVRVSAAKINQDYGELRIQLDEESLKRRECEARITRLEAEFDAARILQNARDEAARLLEWKPDVAEETKG